MTRPREPTSALSVRVRGVVQGVGFRPFVFRLARTHALAGWVLNGDDGVEIHVEGAGAGLDAFLRDLTAQAPPAAAIARVEVEPVGPSGATAFDIRESDGRARPTVRIAADLAVCGRCLTELFDPADPRFLYPYINCTDCGPRYSIILSLPYDRAATTMAAWAMDRRCAGEYHDPASRRFHAQPVACPQCGPRYHLRLPGAQGAEHGDVVATAVRRLRAGEILAVKGLGGYHLACDARHAGAVTALRERKVRKEKPFALMARNLEVARRLVVLSPAAEALLTSTARPIVLAPAQADLPGVAPENRDLGVMLPYTPLHHLLFAAGAPDVLVMTSANRSNETIAYEDEDAFQRLSGIADAFLVGERPIARRVEDSVVGDGPLGPTMLRRGRGYAPGAVATLPTLRPILALGADLKNTVTLVVEGQAFVSQFIGDLDDFTAFAAFEETIWDLLAMYRVDPAQLLVVRDAHPQYHSTAHAERIEAADHVAVQHHRAHIASVLAERGAWSQRVVGVSFDGTGFGDDGSIWGGEVFVGSVDEGFTRVAHLRPSVLVGGDAAARHPVQAAAGFLHQIDGLPPLAAAPFHFPSRYQEVAALLEGNLRLFPCTSVGRLFDAAAALLGFTRPVTFEGQAAIWLEHLARDAPAAVDPYPFPWIDRELDFRPLVRAVADDRRGGRPVAEIARAFHAGVAQGLTECCVALSREHDIGTVVVSGGVFQNALLLRDLEQRFEQNALEVWTNHAVPPNDGGISLGQAALAAMADRAASPLPPPA
jgi:hydrogenase maturation protein HypF